MLLIALQRLRTITRDIHLTAKDRFERFQPLLFATLVDAAHIVMEFLDAEHVSMVGNGHASHTIADGFVHQSFDTGLSIKYRVIGMYVQMYEIFHKMLQ